MRSCRMQGRVIRDTWRLLRCSFAPSYGLREATARRRWKTRTPSWVLPGRRRIPRCSFRPSRFTVTCSLPPITRADAGAFLDELIERRQAFPSGLVSHWVIPFVVVLKALGPCSAARGDRPERDDFYAVARGGARVCERRLFRGRRHARRHGRQAGRSVRAPACSGGARRGRQARRGQRPAGACARLLPLGRRHGLRPRG